MTTVHALVVPAGHDEVPRLVQVDTTTSEGLGALVGGWLEIVKPGSGGTAGWHAYCDEEGKIKDLRINAWASSLAWRLGWPRGDVLCGPVVFLGDGEDGEEADVPREIVVLFATMVQEGGALWIRD